jgi:acetyltransferase
MAEYPAQLVHEHALADGRKVTIRPIRSDDAARVRDFIAESSAETRYLRFQKWVHAPSDKLVHFLTDVDYERHLALVCTAVEGGAEEVVGEARYVANPDGKTCELGIMIADAWQKTGIAGILMQALIGAACDRGLTLMEGLVLSTNTPMLRFARALGFEVQAVPEDRTTVRIVRKLAADPRGGSGYNAR